MQHFALGDVVLIAEVGEMLMDAEMHASTWDKKGHGSSQFLLKTHAEV